MIGCASPTTLAHETSRLPWCGWRLFELIGKRQQQMAMFLCSQSCHDASPSSWSAKAHVPGSALRPCLDCATQGKSNGLHVAAAWLLPIIAMTEVVSRRKSSTTAAMTANTRRSEDCACRWPVKLHMGDAMSCPKHPCAAHAPSPRSQTSAVVAV